MADNPKPSAFKGSETAPIVYFDTVGALGVMAGAIQVELVARTMNPDGKGGISNDQLVTGHMRCSPAAALDLRNSLDTALAMLQESQNKAPADTKFN